MKKPNKLWYMLAIAASLIALAVCSLACATIEQPPEPSGADYTITLKLNADQNWDVYTGKAGSEVKFDKPIPTRPQNVFEGWSLTVNGDPVELPTVMPEENRVYYAVFSRYYSIALDAKQGTLDASETTVSAKADQNIYSLVKDIIPQAPGTSTFDGWYYCNTKIDADSVAVAAPGITLEARYTVDYTIDLYSETGYQTDEFVKGVKVGNEVKEKLTGVGFIGALPAGADYPVAEGHVLGNTSAFILDAYGDNAFDAYYKLRGFSLVFNANAPASDITVGGSMDILEWGYNEENELPECGFNINGYRFLYWSSTPDGSDKLDGTYKIDGNDIVYAIWSKGYTDAYGKSSDYIFIDGSTAYLQRYYADEVIGEYNNSNKTFTFKNDKDAVILHGKIYEQSGTFAYYNTSTYSWHKLGYAEETGGFTGTVQSNVTLALADDGTAVYNNGTTAIDGTYEFVTDEQSMKFTSAAETFYFRIVAFQNDAGAVIDVFEIRSETEIGEWQSVKPNGDVDANYSMSLNGYGEVVMTATTIVAEAPITVSGNYRFMQASTDEKPELLAVFVTSGGSEMIRFTLFDDTETAAADAKNTKFYKAWNFGTTVYAKPADGEEFDPDTADKFVLDGYGIYDDSATFTTGGQTKSGKYVADTDTRTIEFDGVEYFLDMYSVTNGENTTVYYVYESKQAGKPELTGFYAISGLESVFTPGRYYYYRFFNDGVARLYLYMPQGVETFGNVVLDFIPAVVGEYGLVEGTTENEYYFKATITPEQISIVAAYYMALSGSPLDISRFGDFKFKFTGTDDNGYRAGEVTALGDGYAGYSLVESGVTYVTDGYGKAIATNSATGATVSRKYAVSSALGLPSIVMQWTEIEKNDANEDVEVAKSQIYTLLGDKFYALVSEYGKYNTQYSSQVPDTTFRLVIYSENYAALMYDNARTRSTRIYSYGKVVWTDEAKEFGSYNEIATVDSTASILVSRYGDFKFGFKTVTVTESNGKTKEEVRIFIYDADEVIGGKFTVTNTDGASLTLDLTNATAEYIGTDENDETVTVSGEFKFYDDTVVIMSLVTIEEQDYIVSRSFGLVRDTDGKIVSFKEIGPNSGLWNNSIGDGSQLYLSGELAADSTDAYVGTYYEYDAETESLVAHEGTYKRTENTSTVEYEFTYNETVEQVDENGETQNVHPTFRFIVAYDSATRLPLFRVYTLEVGLYLYSSLSGDQAVAILSGGGYSDLVLQTATGGQTVGQLGIYPNASLFIENATLCVFTNMSGSQKLFFALIGGETPRAVILDGTYSDLNFGRFYYNEDTVLTIPVADEDGNYTDEQVKIDGIMFNGLGIALLVPVSDGGDAENTRVYSVAYMLYNNSTYVLFAFKGEEPVIIAQFRLYNNSAADPDRPYTVRFADTEMNKLYTNDNGANFITDGFSSAVFVDDKGVVHSGIYARVAEHPEVVRITYIDGLSVFTVYVEIDPETAAFEMLDNSDPRIPSDTNDDNG